MSKKINEVFFMRPWAMKEDVLTSLTEIVLRHIAGQKLSEAEIESRTGADKKAEPPDYMVDANGLARIPVYGVIAKRANMVNGISKPRGTSVEEIRKDFLSAVDDPAVKAIALDVDSPGGSVDGIAELSDIIFNARGKKPITAYTDGQMASAAYWIGSSADRIYASKSAEVGSIGVYAVIHDYSRAVKNEGIDTVVFKAGKYKAAGNPYKHMTDDDQAAIQDTVNSYYDLFVEGVARNRGLNADAALKLANGKTYIGKKALDIGLIDGIQNIEDIFNVTACNTGDEHRRRKNAQEPMIVKCQGCQTEFDFNINRAVGQGLNECPTCKKMITQAGEVTAAIKADVVSAVTIEKVTKTKEGNMEFKDLTVDALKKERPELVEAVANNAKAEGVKDGIAEGVKTERARCVGIFTKSEAYKDVEGVSDVVKTALEKGDDVVTAESAFKDKKLAALQKEAPKAAGPGEDVDRAKTAKTHLEAAKEYKAANKCSMEAALKATDPHKVRKVV